MKRLNVIILLAALSSYLFGQGWQFSSVLKGSNIEPKYSVVDQQGSIYILSQFTDTIYSPLVISYGLTDLLICKISSTGELIWYEHVGNSKSDIPGGITIDGGSLYITGTFYDTCRFVSNNLLINTGSGDIFLAKYGIDGSFSYAKRVVYASTLQSSTHLKFDGSQNILMTGFFRDSLIIGSNSLDLDTLIGSTNTSNFIAAFNLNGDHLWSKKILGNNNLSRFHRIGISQNGYYYGGYFQGSLFLDIGTIVSYAPTTYDAFVYKTDFNGNGQWVRRIRGQSTENFRTLTTDEFDNVYVLGNYNSASIFVDSTETITNTYSGNTGGYDTYMAKYNRSGILQWFLRKGSTAKDVYNDFVVRNNVIYATGYFANQIIFNNDTLQTDNPLNEDAFLAAFNEIGDPIAGVSIQGTSNYNDAGTVVNMDANSRAYVSGYYRSQQIQIGDQTYTSNNINKSDLFFAIYQQPLQAVITDEREVSCNGLSDGMLTVTPYFGRPPYTYSWSHNAGLNNPVANNLPAGTYTVTVTDANNVQAFKTESVTQPQPLAIAELITPASCYNGEDGAIDITVTGGTKTTDYNYFWTSLNGSGIVPLNQDQTGLTDGTYTVLVHDDNNCEVTKDMSVTQPARFGYAGTVVTPITVPPGSNGSVNLTVTGGTSPYAFAWAGPLGSGYTASTEDIAVLSAAGLYTLTLTDSKSCITDTSFAVNDNITMFAQITAKTDVLCYGDNDGSATVTVYNGTAPYSYQWSDGVTLVGVATRTNMAPGNYNVLVTDGAMHTSQASVRINTPPSALNLVLATQDLRCYQDNSGVVNLTATGGMLPYSFSWSNGYTGEDLVNVAKGTYTITLTDANNCTAQASAELDEPAAIGLDITISGEILCYGEQGISATANTSGGVGSFSYLWDDPGTQTTKTAFQLAAGTYHVTVTDESGCTKTSSTTLLEPEPLAVVAELTEPSCPGEPDGIIAPTVSGGTPGFEYSWSNGKFERFNTDIAAGTYTLTVTDDNNCILVQEFTITDPDTLEISDITTTDLTCSGHNDGSVAIIATGGTGTIEYSVDGGDSFVSTATVEALTQGDYLVQVRDANGCVTVNYPVTLAKSETCGMVIYDAFSPNADGKNDVWHIGNVENFPGCSVKIFNIWGIAVFSSDGYGEPWDGKYKGNDLPSGTYYYVIDPGDGSENLTGAVSIVY